ncbi:hypothetical protein D3C76_1004480 [compost metagenome]
MRARGRMARCQRKTGLCPVQGLDLTLLIDTEHQSLVRRIQVKPDDVLNLVDERRVGREFEGPLQVWLEPERPPDALHARR